MQKEIENKLSKLSHLLETAQKPKILWEEIQIVSDHAFTLQDELTLLLDEAEESETDIQEIQDIFAAREAIWDAVSQIAKIEMQLKEKTFTKQPAEKNKKGCCRNKKKETKSHTCCHTHEDSGHHHCCGKHNHTSEHSCCCHSHEDVVNIEETCCCHHSHNEQECSYKEKNNKI